MVGQSPQWLYVPSSPLYGDDNKTNCFPIEMNAHYREYWLALQFGFISETYPSASPVDILQRTFLPRLSSTDYSGQNLDMGIWSVFGGEGQISG